MFFLTNTYRYIKLTLALICLVFGVVITVYGFSGDNNVPVIVGGIIMILAALFLALDGSKILADLRNEVSRLAGERREFDLENKELSANVDKLREENGELVVSVSKIKNQIEEKNKQLKESKILLEKQELQLKQQTKNNQEMSEQVHKFQTLNANLKAIILTMAQTIDQSNHLANTLSSSIAKIESVSNDVLRSAEIMSKLQIGLSSLKFRELDVDSDGAITQLEWEKMIQRV
jgi:methyl-accepting chemotaxis protein